jgi:GTPase SAR1 family protein
VEEAREQAEESERLARASGDPLLHRRALEVLERIRSRKEEAPEAVEADADGDATLPEGGAKDELLGEYAARRTSLVRAGREILAVLGEPELQEAAKDLRGRATMDRIAERLARIETGQFRIGVVGEFSSGKSTFLNALLGDAVLPSSIRPTTSAPNRIHYGETPAIRVTFADGRQADAALDELPSYTTEKGNPKNQRGVVQIEIAYPLPLLARGVELIDTPGVGSLIEAHTRLTYELLPSCDALILLATARQPYTESIEKFLGALREAVAGKVFYILNKIDQIEPANRQVAIDFAATRVAQAVEGARVFPTSAYRALVGRRLRAGKLDAAELDDDPRAGDERDPTVLIASSGMPELERELGVFLMRTRGNAMLREAARDIREALGLVEQQVVAKRKASQLGAQERLDAHRRLSADLAQRRAAITKTLERLDGSLARALAELRGRAEREIPTLCGPILDAVCITGPDVESKESLAVLERRVGEVTRERTRRWVYDTTTQASREVADGIESARNELLRHRRELRSEFSEVLADSVNLARLDDALPPFEIQLDSNLAGNVAISAVVGFLGGLLLGVVGVLVASVLGPWVARALQGGVEGQIGRVRVALETGLRPALANLAPQVSADIDTRFGEAIRAWRAQLDTEREQVLAEFDAQLSTLVLSYEDGDAVARNASALLDRLQQRARAARVVLDGLAKGDGR